MERTHYSIAERRSLNLAHEMLDAIFHKGEVDRMSELIASDKVPLHHPVPGLGHDRDGFARMVTDFHAGFSGFDVIAEHMLVRDGVAVIRWKLEGRHTGTWLDVPASGNDVSTAGVIYCECDTEQDPVRVLEHWLHFDSLGLLRQIGGLASVVW
jgi:predicted ester cyclase